MDGKVLSQIFFRTKYLPTMFTIVRLLPSVRKLVNFQITTCSEGLSTYITGERFLPYVCANVSCETVFVSRRVFTVGTREGLLTSVDTHMIFQVAFLRKFFTTVRACMRFFTTMNSLLQV